MPSGKWRAEPRVRGTRLARPAMPARNPCAALTRFAALSRYAAPTPTVMYTNSVTPVTPFSASTSLTFFLP